jgi:hypothetical protein
MSHRLKSYSSGNPDGPGGQAVDEREREVCKDAAAAALDASDETLASHGEGG